jgi:sarcosine oxidase subunit beta
VVSASKRCAFRRHGDRIVAVETPDHVISTECVVNAAGPWAAEVARQAGLSVPVTPLRRQVAATVPCEALPTEMPMTLFVEDGFHLRVRDGRVLLLLPSPGNPQDPTDVSVEPAWVERVSALAAERIPRLAGVPVDPAACWAGLYEMTPDKHAIVGAAPGCENFFYANGSSGHGVMHAPAIGQLLAEIIVKGRGESLDVSPLRPSRFDEGQPNPYSELL